jgi:acyl carrier protein
LPAPETVDPAPASEYAAPRNETEQTLAAIWEEVLRLELVSVHANFFELGGHSLLAAQVNSRVADKLALELPVRAIFEHPTVADLAEHIEAVKWALAYCGPTATGAAEDSEWGEL